MHTQAEEQAKIRGEELERLKADLHAANQRLKDQAMAADVALQAAQVDANAASQALALMQRCLKDGLRDLQSSLVGIVPAVEVHNLVKECCAGGAGGGHRYAVGEAAPSSPRGLPVTWNQDQVSAEMISLEDVTAEQCGVLFKGLAGVFGSRLASIVEEKELLVISEQTQGRQRGHERASSDIALHASITARQKTKEDGQPVSLCFRELSGSASVRVARKVENATGCWSGTNSRSLVLTPCLFQEEQMKEIERSYDGMGEQVKALLEEKRQREAAGVVVELKIGDGVLWSEDEVSARIADAQVRWEAAAEEQRHQLTLRFARERDELERMLEEARATNSNSLQTVASVEAAKQSQVTELEDKMTHLRRDLVEAQAQARESRSLIQQLGARQQDKHAPPYLMAALAQFQDEVREFRSGLRACRDDVGRAVAAAGQDLVGFERLLQGYVRLVMPLTHAAAPVELDTGQMSRQQLSMGLCHVLSKNHELQRRAAELSRSLQLATGRMRVVCRFAPPVPRELPGANSSPLRGSPERGDCWLGEELRRGREQKVRELGGQAPYRRGRSDVRSHLLHFRGDTSVSLWSAGGEGRQEVDVDEVFGPECSQRTVFNSHRALLDSVIGRQNVKTGVRVLLSFHLPLATSVTSTSGHPVCNFLPTHV